ncbi:DUF389 domain-containing protein [Stakelama tenebrarum]|uniref:DUF389 domain-containing protein n=1 Tax=Stakelama tenebrarum TaxID=2711215 RepID=A0A6G6Y119_9SPHN|nr:DUF389 domain-containing protein [Sphingosinithalassobacter tenebrarum]QIG78507.1 DUF389 domain-containing protein [Sphingosinithalassobacter tenebrarum]
MEAHAGTGLRHNPLLDWWRANIVASIEHVRVVEKVRGESLWSARYAFMILMSAGIAVLGLLQSSAPVVIGAMLLSPLMGPIMGLGFGLATFDWAEIRASTFALLVGSVIAVLFTAIIVLFSPLQNVTPEIAARTRPTLFDLGVALFSALAGAYAMVRGREGTIVGVAIATALMPPLAVMGFGLATMNWTVLGGSTLLFVTNLMTIAVAAAVVARFYGFGTHLSPQHTVLQTVVVVAILIAFAIPLGLTLGQIAWETNASRQIRDVITSQFENDARVDQVDVDFRTDPITATATILTPEFQSDAETDSEATLSRLLDRPVDVTLEQYRVSTSAQAEAQQLASAQASARALAADRLATRTAEQLALVAGVEQNAVLLDRDHQRAVVTAAPLPGATLAAYYALEQRVAAAATNDWTVVLIPPAAPLPQVTFGDASINEAGEATPAAPDAEGRQAIAIAAWGSRRLNVPLGVSGRADRVAQVIESLRQAGITALDRDGTPGRDGAVRLEWLAPSEAARP